MSTASPRLDTDGAFAGEPRLLAAAFRALPGRAAWAEHGDWTARTQPAMGAGITERFAVAARVTDAVVIEVQIRGAAIRDCVLEASRGGRVLLGLAATGPARFGQEPPKSRQLTRLRTFQLTCVAGLAGASVVVVPGAEAEGFALGVACLGAPGSDRALLRWVLETLAV
jgi:amidase